MTTVNVAAAIPTSTQSRSGYRRRSVVLSSNRQVSSAKKSRWKSTKKVFQLTAITSPIAAATTSVSTAPQRRPRGKSGRVRRRGSSRTPAIAIATSAPSMNHQKRPIQARTSVMWRTSRAPKAGFPSGRRAARRSAIPGPPGSTEWSPVSPSDVRCAVVKP